MNNEPMSDERLAEIRSVVTRGDYLSDREARALLAELDHLRVEASQLRHLLGSHADGHRCTCTMISAGDHINPPEWEQDPWCLTHPNMDAVTQWHAETVRERDEARAALARVTDDSNPPAWIDRHGDVWVFPGSGDTGYSFETQPFSRTHIEKKWGPLTPLVRAVAAGEPSSYAEAIAPITKQSQQWAETVDAGEQTEGDERG